MVSNALAVVRNSLAVRLILTAAVWSAAALAIAAFVLVTLERKTIERRFEAALGIHAKAIIGEISALEPGQIAGADIKTVSEPRFDLPLHGWYWQVTSKPDSEVLATSPSLVGERLEALPAGDAYSDGPARSGGLIGPNQDYLRAVEYDIVFEDSAYAVVVAAETSSVDNEVAAFRNNLLVTFGIFGIGLIAAIFIQVKIGLRPLSRLREEMGAIRGGETEQLEGDYPVEIAPVVEELNALVSANSEIVDRARTQVGNLAHALKTPLSVIKNEARATGTPEMSKVSEQADVMRHQVDMYLDRARKAAQRRVIGAVTEIGPVLERLRRVMERLHRDRGLQIDLYVEPDLKSRCEAQDFEEMLGNLLDNACKWADQKVLINALSIGKTRRKGRAMLSVIVEDDGPGLPADKREEALQRGKRLDESVPGTGLGLSIVSDLAEVYGGELRLGDGQMSGLRAELRLPNLEHMEKTARPKFRQKAS